MIVLCAYVVHVTWTVLVLAVVLIVNDSNNDVNLSSDLTCPQNSTKEPEVILYKAKDIMQTGKIPAIIFPITIRSLSLTIQRAQTQTSYILNI
jgi:hypothetical protein